MELETELTELERGKGNGSMRPPVVKLLFRFTQWLLLQLSIELATS